MRCLGHVDTVMEITDCKPPPGIDPRLRQFRCPICLNEDYKIPTGGERFQLAEGDPLRPAERQKDILI